MTDEAAPAFAPCPTCGQYDHSIHGDQLAEAFMHFEMMFSHRGDGIPTQPCFDERTRDAAQVLVAAARAVQQVDDAMVERAILAIRDLRYTARNDNASLARAALTAAFAPLTDSAGPATVAE